MTRPLVVLVVLLATAAPNAAGQGRSVRGMVTDQAGEPLRGAVVKIKNALTLQIRSYITQADGEYRFHGLHRDVDYKLKARFRGQTSKVRTLNWYDSRPQAQIDFKLRLKDGAHRAATAPATSSLMYGCGELLTTAERNPNDF